MGVEETECGLLVPAEASDEYVGVQHTIFSRFVHVLFTGAESETAGLEERT